MTRGDILITSAELERRLGEGQRTTVLDVRWQLTRPDGGATYGEGHLPGAVYVSLEDELSDHTVPGPGRRPLPTGAAVQAAARRWGISEGVLTVV